MRMDRILSLLLIIAASLFSPPVSWGQGKERSNALQLIDDFSEADYQLNATNLSPEAKREIANKREEIVEKLLADREAAELALVKEYKKAQSRGSVSLQYSLMNVSSQIEIAVDDFLGIAREIVETADLQESRDPLLSIALYYLSAHGNESDLERMRRIDGHTNPAYVRLRDQDAAQLSDRLKSSGQPQAIGLVKAGSNIDGKGIGTEGRDEAPPEIEVKKPNGTKYFIALTVVALAIFVVLLLRINRRNT